MQRTSALFSAVCVLVFFCLSWTAWPQDKIPKRALNPAGTNAVSGGPSGAQPEPGPEIKPEHEPEVKPDAKYDIRPEIKPAELSLGAASPVRESSNTMVLKKSSPGFARWSLQGPPGWIPNPGMDYSGMLGSESLQFRITLRCYPAKEFPAEDRTYVPLELAFESAAGKFTFGNELLPGRHKARFAFVFEGVERIVNLYFRILKTEGPVLLADTHGLEFG